MILVYPGLSQKQRGSTMLITMTMLILLTMVLITSFNISKSNLVVVGNMQHKNEALAAAQQAIEEAISTTRLTESPEGIFLQPCAGPNTMCFDNNGDGKNDITVTLWPTPTCVIAKGIKNAELDLANQADLVCAVGTQQSFGVAGSVTGDSRCAYSVWDVNAVAVDEVTGARAEIGQGVGVRVLVDDIEAECPLS